jgi:histidyl-tRNA synthetase
MNLQNARGTRDFPPEDKILRNKVVDRLKEVFERYGYSPLETPLIERYDVLCAKCGAGEESDAMKETFQLSDQGNRKLGLRFDLTLPFSRFIGMNPTMKMPFKRYEFGPVFRDGPIKLGRYRQFWQCDVDIVGTNNMMADAEIIRLSLDCFKALALDAYIQINNRKLLKGIIEFAGISQKEADSVIISIDKLEKTGKAGVVKELEEKNIEDKKIAKLLSAFDMNGSNEEKLVLLTKLIQNEIGKEGLNELHEILSYLNNEQKKHVVFNPALARGLSYYTGPIFEGYLRDNKITSSVCGGGRYDCLIGGLLGTKKEYPAMGISFGLDVITDALRLTAQQVQKTVTQAYIIPIGTQKESLEIAQKIRDQGVKVDIDLSSRGISKNLQYASALNIPFVVIIGEDELKQNKIKLRNMITGTEKMFFFKDLLKEFGV